MKKTDLILIFVVLVIFVSLAILFNHKKGGDVATVTHNGTIVDTIDLSKDGNYRYDFEEGYNIVLVDDGKVRVIESNCTNQNCVNQGFVENTNDAIICLPHKFCVTVKSNDVTYDAVTN